MGARRYTLGLLAGIALLLGLASAVNRVVDPYWFYRDVEIEGFNAVKPRFARYVRHVKPQLLARERPQAIVLGSSFSEIGFDPGNPALTAGGTLRGYNFAFAGAGWSLVQCHFAYARSVTRLKRVVVGLHPEPMGAGDCSKLMPEVRAFSQVNLLLSLQAVNQSLRTVLEQRRGRSSHTPEGRYLYARGDAGVAARFREHFHGLAHRDPRCSSERAPAKPPPSREIAPALPVPSAAIDLSGLRAMVRAARADGIELRFFIYPQHALLQELEMLCGIGMERWAAYAAMAQAVAEEAPDGSAQLWLFNDYNAVTGESITKRNPAYWQDPEHFNYEMGALMLSDMYGSAPVGAFGRHITPDNVAATHRAFLAARDRYVSEHPGFYDELRAALTPLR
jgi:hypothetical protein